MNGKGCRRDAFNAPAPVSTCAAQGSSKLFAIDGAIIYTDREVIAGCAKPFESIQFHVCRGASK